MSDMLDDLYEEPQEERSEEDYPSCPFLLEKAPRIHDFLRFDRYKGKPRTPGRLSVTSEGSLWVVSINDQDRRRSFSGTGHTFTEAIEFLDQCIASKQIHWRYWGNPTNGDIKKKTGTKK